MTNENFTENSHIKAIEWAQQTLSQPKIMTEVIVDTPWSHVLRFETSDCFIYLKHTPPLIGLEPKIINILHEQFHAKVPTIIAHNADLNCFLMQDAGVSLRSILKKQFDETLLCKAITQFTALQLSIAPRVDMLLDIGVPDWRLDKLPELYKILLSDKEILISDGLLEHELLELEALFPIISNLCKKLSDFPIKETLVQPDCNDNNTLVKEQTQEITLIDLGEISISHPFFSLLNFLEQIQRHYGVKKDDAIYLRILDACLKNYMKNNFKEEVLAAFATAKIVWPIYWVLAQYRLMLACGKEKIMAYQPGRLCGSFKALMASLK